MFLSASCLTTVWLNSGNRASVVVNSSLRTRIAFCCLWMSTCVFIVPLENRWAMIRPPRAPLNYKVTDFRISTIILIETNMWARAIRDLLDTRSKRAW